MGERSTKKFKVVLLGEGRVGKTSILLRYIKGEYDERQVSTLQASYLDKRLMVDNRRVALSLWDTAGQERFHALGPIYYRDADGALLVYDITDAESFRKVRTWVRELRRIVGDDISICIAGNKSDLHRNRKVPEDEARRYAESVGAAHFDTSAKLNRGLEDVFVELTRRMLSRSGGKKKKGSALIADDDDDDVLPPPVSNRQKQQQQQVQKQQVAAQVQHGARAEEPPRSRGGGGGSPFRLWRTTTASTPERPEVAASGCGAPRTWTLARPRAAVAERGERGKILFGELVEREKSIGCKRREKQGCIFAFYGGGGWDWLRLLCLLEVVLQVQ